MFKTYRGYGGLRGTRVTVQTGIGPEEPLKHHVRHSPDGFSWGYGGSGPSELARCILIDHRGQEEAWDNDLGDYVLNASYQDFKFDVVARWPWVSGGGSDIQLANARSLGPVWTLTSAEIDRWLAGDRVMEG